MKKLVASINAPGRLTVLAALMAGLSFPALAASTDIVVSQVSSGGGNGTGTSANKYKNDFIELFNPTGSAVTLTGWSVQYASATGNTWAKTDIPDTVMQPGQYFLVQQAPGAGDYLPLPAPDASGTLTMSATAGKVALVRNRTLLTGTSPNGTTHPALADLVGFGTTASAFEGTAPAPAPSNPTAVLRKNGGCLDADANNTDFEIGAPTPRNSASPVNACGAAPTYQIVTSCPGVSLKQGENGSGVLSASDVDGIVNNAVITSGAVAGIALSGFTASSANGASASVNLGVSSAVPAGSYDVVVNFSNNQQQEKSCTVNVNVQGLAAVTYTIPEIQGSGATSTHLGSQTTEGVVTAKVATGFFLQDARANGDGDPTTSDAMFVYTGGTPANVAIGDLVRVSATVVEFTPTKANRSYTEMTNPTSILVQDSGRSVGVTNIEFPNTDLARYEAMLVSFPGKLTISQSAYLGQRGELTLSSGRLETPTNRFPPRSPEAIALAAQNAANMLVLDDGIFVTPTVIPYIGADGTVRVGDTITGLTGVLDFGAIGGGNPSFKLQPTVAPSIVRENPRPSAPGYAAGNVKVASANVLNFFTTFTNGNNVFGATGQTCTVGTTSNASSCRGANSLAEFNRQRDKIVASLKIVDADVVGLMEIQNNGEIAVSYLVDALNAAIGSTTYAYVPKPPDTGDDAIRVAMIYKPAKLTLAGAAISDSDPVHNRPPMAATFRLTNGAKFSLIVNHFKSKSNDGCPGTGLNSDMDGQGCFNNTRVLQAQRLADFLPLVTAAAGDPDVLVIGDLNAHGFEDPIKVLTDAGMINELERYVRPSGMVYSYVFGGQSGYLDHALSTPAMSAQVSGAGEFHNNADEPTVIDYNLDGKPQDLYVNDAYRASDHDPVIVSLDLAPTFIDVTAGFSVMRSGLAVNRFTGKYTGTLTFTNTTGAPINGPFNVLFDGLSAGVTLDNKSGTYNGAPYITVNNASIAPGAKVTVSMTFSNPSKAVVGYTTKIISGTF